MRSENSSHNSISTSSIKQRSLKVRKGFSTTAQSKEIEKPKSSERKAPRVKSRSRLAAKSSIKSNLSLAGEDENNDFYIFVFVGASADVAKKKAYPSMWNLFKTNSLPRRVHFIGFSKTPMAKAELRTRCQKYMSIAYNEHEKYENFWSINNFYVGGYQTRFDYDNLLKEVNNLENVSHSPNRIFYISLMGSSTEPVFQNIKTMAQGKSGWTRIVLEKPFARTEAFYDKVAQQLSSSFREDEIYRVDQFLGKDIVRNILPFRFCNSLFSSTWNRKMIQNVKITVKETRGIQGKGKYFDTYGIIREVMQLHLLQLLCFVAMEKPVSILPDDIRDEKVKLLKCIQPVEVNDVVLGQYTGDPLATEGEESKLGYMDDPDVEPNSNTPTYCAAALLVKNERWDGVPFILECGNALDEFISEIRIRYRHIPADIFDTRESRNELVIRIEPEEKLYIKAVTKLPLSMGGSHQTNEIPLDSTSAYVLSNPSHEYDNILNDVFKGVQTFFIRNDELTQAWRIFTPLLELIDEKHVQPIKYQFGSKGPEAVADLIKKYSGIDW